MRCWFICLLNPDPLYLFWFHSLILLSYKTEDFLVRYIYCAATTAEGTELPSSSGNRIVYFINPAFSILLNTEITHRIINSSIIFPLHLTNRTAVVSPALKYLFKREVSSLITLDKPFNFQKEPCLYTHSLLGVLLSPWLLPVGKQRLWLSNWQSQLSASQSCLIQNLRITLMNHKTLCYLPQQQSKYSVLQFHSLEEEAWQNFFSLFVWN